MSNPIIVLHVVGRLDIGGAESRIMDMYRHIDREKVQFAFCQHTTDRCAFEDEIESLGGKVYHVPRFNVKNYFSYKKAWSDFFKQHPEIKVVHGHMTSTAAIYLPIAKKAGIEITIAHARSAGVDPGLKGYVTRFLRRNLYKKCDYRFTCSKIAGDSVFGDQNLISKKAAGRLEFSESQGINGLKAVILMFPGKCSSLKSMNAIGNSPLNSTFLK